MLPRRSYGLFIAVAISLSLGLLFLSLSGSLSTTKILDSFQPSRLGKNADYRTELTVEIPPEQPPFGALVVASGADTDLRWTDSIRQNWTFYEYDIRRPNHPDPRLRFPTSKGHEAMIYLTYIINNYEFLPWGTIFMHGHPEAWHQEANAAELVQGLNRTALAQQGYISLRCDWYPSCPAEMRPVHHDAFIWGPGVHTKGTEAAIAGNWRLLFPEEQVPETIASPCCAQFAVSRQAIFSRPKSDYERLRDWLQTSLLEDDLSGRVLEKLWAYIFTSEAVHCPPPRQCACEWFGRCNSTEFAQPPEGLAPLPDWP